jgi:hypothetical protein
MPAFGETPALTSQFSAPQNDIVVHFVEAGRVNTALEYVRIGRKLDRFRETARMVLEP